MTQIDQIATRLQQAIDCGALPPERRSVGQKLVAQLTNPPHIAVVGLAGSGKTSLVNMALGERVMPDLGIVTTELCFGATDRLRLELADGTVRTRDGLADGSGLPPGVVRITQELPDPRLKDWSFVEVSLSGPGPAPQHRLEWIAKRADIVIWCSQRFDDRERALWSTVPEHLKDHSFLVLTKADQLFLKRELAERIAELQPMVAEEFLGLYPVATMQAIAARGTAADHDQTLWQTSGGKAFLQAIRQQVDLARMADLDQAQMLLDRYRASAPSETHTPNRAASAQRGTTATPVDARTAAAPTGQDRPTRKSATDQAVDRALRLLQSCADELMASADPPGSATADRILDRCNEVAEDLVAILSTPDSLTDDLAPFRDDAVEGEQMLMLLRLERGESASTDALTVLLQLKKELSERAVS